MAQTSQVYLFLGSENGQKNVAIDALKTTFKKTHQTIDEHSFYATETCAKEVISFLQNGSLFSSGSFVVFKNIEVIKKKEDIEALCKYIGVQEEQNAVLILLSDEYSVDKKIENAIPKENQKRFWEMFESQKVPWLCSLFQKEGLKLSPQAASDILELVENDTQTLKNSCLSFFVCLPQGHIVTPLDVENILSHNKQETPFTLFEAMAQPKQTVQQRLEKSLCILQTLSLAKDSSAISLIAGLSYCFKMLATYHSLLSSGKTSDFDLKTNGFASKKSQKRYSLASSCWNAFQTYDCISCLGQADFDMRQDGSATADTRLEILIYQLVAKKGQSLHGFKTIDF